MNVDGMTLLKSISNHLDFQAFDKENIHTIKLLTQGDAAVIDSILMNVKRMITK